MTNACFQRELSDALPDRFHIGFTVTATEGTPNRLTTKSSARQLLLFESAPPPPIAILNSSAPTLGAPPISARWDPSFLYAYDCAQSMRAVCAPRASGSESRLLGSRRQVENDCKWDKLAIHAPPSNGRFIAKTRHSANTPPGRICDRYWAEC